MKPKTAIAICLLSLTITFTAAITGSDWFLPVLVVSVGAANLALLSGVFRSWAKDRRRMRGYPYADK